MSLALAVLGAVLVVGVYEAAPQYGAPLLIIVVLLLLGHAVSKGFLTNAPR